MAAKVERKSEELRTIGAALITAGIVGLMSVILQMDQTIDEISLIGLAVFVGGMIGAGMVVFFKG